MTLLICPNCQTRHIAASTQTDFVCECHSGDLTLDQEDILVTGDWEDFTGSAEVQKAIISTAGTANQFQGTRVEIENPLASIDDFTDRGKRGDLYRQRQKFEFIQLR